MSHFDDVRMSGRAADCGVAEVPGRSAVTEYSVLDFFFFFIRKETK